ncbi:phage major capsid protein, HK97 family [Marinobacter segnicrescens]|uniref:Phage major capsid protein, HK97 family n=1 Tax=Marinobacter segnicrescens TaxID=430453 RepID=A0A1I0H7L8_9GAMM|nr:phage major capsid protein [Marinobacter segnicrescens]SET79762.1 phage major capsid protein, HK97 family [Marinobacter segnicrescens]
MNEELKAMLEQLKELQTEVRANQEAGEKVETLTAQIDELRGQIDTISAAANRPTVGGEVVDAEVQKRSELFESYARKGIVEELRTLDGSTDADGAVFMPEQLAARIKTNAAQMNEIRKYASVNRTGNSSVLVPTLSRPKSSYGTVAPTPEELASGFTRLEVHDCKSLVVIPENSLSDSQYDLEAKLEELFSESLSEEEGRAFIVGTGIGEPLGIVSADTKANAVTSLASGSLGADDQAVEDLINKALYKLKKKYRRNAKIMCNSNTEATLSKVRDGNGNKLLTKEGGVSYFNGIEIVTAEDMDDIASGKFPIVVGDLRQFEVYDRSDMTVKRLTGGEYDTSSTVGFLLKARHAAGVTMTEAFVPVKIKA